MGIGAAIGGAGSHSTRSVHPDDVVFHPKYGDHGRVMTVTTFGPTSAVESESRVVVSFGPGCTVIFRADDLTLNGGPLPGLGLCAWQARPGSGSQFS